jgi:hypothetical protein
MGSAGDVAAVLEMAEDAVVKAGETSVLESVLELLASVVFPVVVEVAGVVVVVLVVEDVVVVLSAAVDNSLAVLVVDTFEGVFEEVASVGVLIVVDMVAVELAVIDSVVVLVVVSEVSLLAVVEVVEGALAKVVLGSAPSSFCTNKREEFFPDRILGIVVVETKLGNATVGENLMVDVLPMMARPLSSDTVAAFSFAPTVISLFCCSLCSNSRSSCGGNCVLLVAVSVGVFLRSGMSGAGRKSSSSLSEPCTSSSSKLCPSCWSLTQLTPGRGSASPSAAICEQSGTSDRALSSGTDCSL